MHVILPISGLANDLYHRARHFTDQHGLKGLSIEGAVDICQSVSEESVFNRLYWTKKINMMDESLHCHLDWWLSGMQFSATTDQSTICQKFFCDIIDPLFCHMSGIIDQYVGPENTDSMWMVWYTRRLGNDLVLEKGPDYRVVEFERCVLSGELNVAPDMKRRIQKRHFLGG